MHLKSLVLKGFKSFADRSVLALEPGITAIVGPNGSGKSNISDAVLWVLGERNAKHLRGQAMEDVIFAGSSARKSVGVAEVDLVLDNTDATLPVEYNEVVITRRMYRSGESEYLINGTVARRMDVLEILHDSGLGSGTHSIISQGSLDSILQSKPEDRRALIEEAAGVLKHKQRKAKSERKLASMDVHLSRVKDVAGEVQRQLGPLERKAKRALAYQGLSSELSQANLALAVDDLRLLRAAWDEASEKEAALVSSLEERREQIAKAEEAAEKLQEQIQKDVASAGELSRRQRRAASMVERFDSATRLLHEKRRGALDAQADLQLTLEANKASRAQALADQAQAQAQLEQARQERSAADDTVARLSEAQITCTGKRRELEQKLQELEKTHRSHEVTLESVRAQLAQTQETVASGMAHVKLIEGHSKELELQLERATADAQSASLSSQKATDKLNGLIDEERNARSAVATKLTERDQARKALDEIRDTVSMLTSEMKGLRELERSSSVSQARRWLLDDEEIQATLEPITHAIHAPQELEALVENLLGADIYALLVGDAADITHIAHLLEETSQQGEVVLMPRTQEASSTLPAHIAAKQGLGRALIDEVTYEPSDEMAVRALLGDVVICNTLADAFLAHDARVAPCRYVALSGEIIWPQGKVTLGIAESSNEESLLARARRLEELQAKLTLAQENLEEAQRVAQAAEDALREAQVASLALSQQLAEQRGEAEAARKEAQSFEEKLSSYRREFSDLQAQREQAEETLAQARPSAEALKTQQEELSEALETEIKHQEQLNEALIPLRKEAAQLRDNLAEAKLKAATLSERDTYTARMVDARARDIAQLNQSDKDTHQTLLRKQVALSRIDPLLSLIEKLTAQVQQKAQTLEDEALAAENTSSGLHQAVSEARSKAKAAHDAFDEMNAQLSQARVDKGRLEVQVDSAIHVIEHDCKTPLDKALELPELEDRSTCEQEAFKLRRRIANMGTINPDAAEEYRVLKERYDYLASQLNDLEQARRSLSKIVRVIDARMKEDFIRTYETVNENFQEIFSILFPGGQAELTLVDPDDLENTGVEVTAQPKGKRITKMMLMSGGEKSLTALALLFAVYRVRSTPFYILDEVEAALDDTNLRRLVSYINELRDSTQLIMITHQRRTMEMADVLFGVSMQADGVTKVVSQKLDRALEYAE